MSPTFTLGFRLAELTNQPDVKGVGVLAFAIKDAGWDAQHISYGEMRQVIEQHLRPRLLKAQTADPDQVIHALLEYLTEKQSLFTISAR
jgi:hypothetical protein